MKSAIYTEMSTATSVPVDGVIPLGSTVRRFGSNLVQNGNVISTVGQGYYGVNAVVNLTGTGTGTITVNLYQDNTLIDSKSITGANAVQYAIPITAIIRNRCCDEQSNLSLVLTGTAVTVNNVDMVVEKL